MNSSGASDERARATDSTQATEHSTTLWPSSKVQSAWKSVRTNFKAKRSIPDLKRWLSYPQASKSNSPEKEGHPEDEEHSRFCDSLLALMQRTGRYDYLDFNKDTPKQEEEGTIEAAQNESDKQPQRSLKRFSWSR